MGTYDTRGGHPRHDPAADYFPPEADHIRVSVDQWIVSIHDTERDDVDWPILWSAGLNTGPTKQQVELANRIAASVRERIEEYEAAADESHCAACEFVEECETIAKAKGEER